MEATGRAQPRAEKEAVRANRGNGEAPKKARRRCRDLAIGLPHGSALGYKSRLLCSSLTTRNPVARSKSSTTRSAKEILRAAAAKVAAAKGETTEATRAQAKSKTAEVAAKADEGKAAGVGAAKSSRRRAEASRPQAKTEVAPKARSKATAATAKKRSKAQSQASSKAAKKGLEAVSEQAVAVEAVTTKQEAPEPVQQTAASAVAVEDVATKQEASEPVHQTAASAVAGEEPSAPAAKPVAAVARAVARPISATPTPTPPMTVVPVRVELPEGYKPSPDEPYMNPMQLEYFRRKLLKWREELVEESRQTLDHLRSEVRDVGDEAERATRESENALELRTRDRYRKLIAKIDAALRRIEDGTYGYCDETGEPIGLERLEARPIATLSLDAQERRELLQRQLGD